MSSRDLDACLIILKFPKKDPRVVRTTNLVDPPWEYQVLITQVGITFWIDEAALAPAVYPLLAHGVKVHPLALFPHSHILFSLMVLSRDQKEIVTL